MGIRAKMMAGFLVLVTMLALAGGWSIFALRNIGASVQNIFDENYKSVDAARLMTMALEREDSAVLLLLSGNWEEGREIIDAADGAFASAFKTAQRNVTIPGEEALVEEIAAAYATYKGLWERPIVGTSRERNLDWYFQDVHAAFLNVRLSVQELSALNDHTMYETASQLQKKARRAAMPGIVAILSALVFSLLFNYFIDYFLVRPIININRGLKAYVESRTAFHVQVETRDELGELAATLRTLLSRVRPAEAE